MKKVAVVALTAVLVVGVTACSSGLRSRPRLGGGVSGTCTLFWTYRSAHGVPEYSSFASAYKADMAKYAKQHPAANPFQNPYWPVLEPKVKITGTSSVNIGSIEVAFYDNSGNETNHRTWVGVHKVLTGGQSYIPDAAADVPLLSDPQTGDTKVASCAVAAWTRRGRSDGAAAVAWMYYLA